jgi:hypothetical protein
LVLGKDVLKEHFTFVYMAMCVKTHQTVSFFIHLT